MNLRQNLNHLYHRLRASGRAALLLAGLLILSLPLALPAAAAPPDVFPKVIPLPDGFQPEGIVTGRGHSFFAGSLANGAIFKGDYRTGQGDVLVEGQAGRIAVGLSYDSRTDYLYVAGGPTGQAYVYNGTTGDEVGVFQLTQQATFVNDVIVTRSAAYFTDSMRPLMYRVPLSNTGALPGPGDVEEIPLNGFGFVPGAFNANGIDATPDGKDLVIVNSTLGTLYRVDPATGTASLIDLGSGSVPAGDGILLDGKTLYVVQNRFNQIAVVQVSPDLSSGEIVRAIGDPNFRVPTTVAEFGDDLYAVNARFGTPPTPDTEYEVVQVSKH